MGVEEWLVYSQSNLFTRICWWEERHIFRIYRFGFLGLLGRFFFFAWLAARGSILTTEDVRKRSITHISWCYYMCKCSGEEVDHLLLHGTVASGLWRVVLNFFGVQWVMPRTVKDMLHSRASRRRRRRQTAWKVAPFALMWIVWRERNMRAFEGIENDFLHLRNSLLSLITFWCTLEIPNIYDWVSFIENHVLL